MYPYREYLFVASLVFSSAMMFAGCSQPEATTPNETLAPEKPAAEAAAPEAAVAEGAPGEGEAATETSLPEVRAVNTTQLGELVEATRGKVTVLNIWATWCGPCVHEMPDLVKFYNESSRDTVAFLSLSVDAESDITEAIPKFQRTHEVPFPIYVLNERNDEGLAKALRAPFEGAIPATYIYDATGKLIKTELGAITLAQLQGLLSPLLESKS